MTTTPDISPEAVANMRLVLRDLSVAAPNQHIPQILARTNDMLMALREALTAAEADRDFYRTSSKKALLSRLVADAEARAEAADKALRIAAGLISTMDGHRDKHPVEVLEWIKHQAHGV